MWGVGKLWQQLALVFPSENREEEDPEENAHACHHEAVEEFVLALLVRTQKWAHLPIRPSSLGA